MSLYTLVSAAVCVNLAMAQDTAGTLPSIQALPLNPSSFVPTVHNINKIDHEKMKALKDKYKKKYENHSGPKNKFLSFEKREQRKANRRAAREKELSGAESSLNAHIRKNHRQRSIQELTAQMEQLNLDKVIQSAQYVYSQTKYNEMELTEFIQDSQEIVKSMVAQFDPNAENVEKMFGLHHLRPKIDRHFAKWIRSDIDQTSQTDAENLIVVFPQPIVPSLNELEINPKDFISLFAVLEEELLDDEANFLDEEYFIEDEENDLQPFSFEEDVEQIVPWINERASFYLNDMEMMNEFNSTEEGGWIQWTLTSVGFMGLGLGACLYLKKREQAKSNEVSDEFKLVE